jgi:hypothetical protein
MEISRKQYLFLELNKENLKWLDMEAMEMMIYLLRDTGLTHGGHLGEFGIGLMITSYTDWQETTFSKAHIMPT